MNESKKTITFVAVAVLVVLIAWIGRPSVRVLTAPELVGKELFAEFKDPRQAASLEIVEFNESTAEIRPFKVAEVEGEWSIPSHHDYPADAKKQLGEAAASMVGLKALDMASDSPGDHKLYGVVDPDPQRLKVGDTGVGTRVTMKDKNDKWLMSVIIGKQVPDRGELRYVRVGDKSGFKDPVYTVAVKTDKLSTKFEDWIEEDLLKLSSIDVRRVRIRDYSADLRQVFDLARGVIGVTLDQIKRSVMTLEYDDKDSKWNLVEDKVFDQQNERLVDTEMADDEELNTTKLNDMKWALDDLEIVDVARKPEGLSENLRATGEVNPDAATSLAARGFYLVRAEDGRELVSSEGEITVLMKDGVQYVLRFGQIAGRGEEAAETEEKKEKPEGEEEAEEEPPSEEGGVNRYLFVMAEFNPDIIPKPEREALPTQEKTPQGEEGNGEAAEAEPAPSETAKDDAPQGKGSPANTEGSDDAKAKPGEDEKADTKAPEKESAEAGPAEKEPAQDEPSKEKASEDEKTEADKKDEKSDLEKERERIEKEYKRKQEEYDEKIEKGEERVKELNARFADWYYVISDDVYKKIHLSRQDVIKKKEKEEEEDEDADKDEAKDENKAAGDQEAEEDKEAQKQQAEDKEAPEQAKDAGQQKPDQQKAAENQGTPSDAAKQEATKRPPEKQGGAEAKQPQQKSAGTPQP